jgi:hypothetical protein
MNTIFGEGIFETEYCQKMKLHSKKRPGIPSADFRVGDNAIRLKEAAYKTNPHGT